jgi:uncharacterized protein YndB with AHSA1/START domain
VAIIDERIEHEIRIQAPPEVVFSYLTDPAKHPAWMGQSADLDARPGGIYRCVMNEQATVRGTYLSVQRPHRVVFTWGFEGNQAVPPGSSTVEITLTRDGDATILRLTHTGLPHPTLASHSQGWQGYLDQLATTVKNRTSPPS